MRKALEVFKEFLVLGLTSFGGPTAHIGFFRERLVKRHQWLTDAEFADLFALCQFLPGPSSSQLGMAIGLKRAGWQGALAAWLGFTLPSALFMVLLGVGVAAWNLHSMPGSDGWLRGLQIAVVIVIIKALSSMWQSLCPDRPHQLIALASASVMLLSHTWWAQLAVIVGGALLALLFTKSPKDALAAHEADSAVTDLSSTKKSSYSGWLSLTAFCVLLLILPWLSHLEGSRTSEAFAGMYRSGALVFGGGHVVLPLLGQVTVDPGWISKDSFIAGYGSAQALPGPLFAFSAYLGTQLGGEYGPWATAFICLVGIFLPSWLLLFGVMPFWDRLSHLPLLRKAMAGTNAAVVGLLGAACYDPLWMNSIKGPTDVVFLIGCAVAMWLFRLPPWLIVIASAVLGGLLLT